MEQVYIPLCDYKVLCLCYSYNQSKYIEDTLNGFAIQKTTFPFLCLVIDDCSTDGEQEIIKIWLERECNMSKAEHIDLVLSNVIIVPHKSNSNCIFAVYLLKRNLYGNPLKKELITPWRDHCKYEAMCEGDDFWIAEDKLQKQVDILDNDFSVNVVYTRSKVFLQSSGTFSSQIGGGPYQGYESMLLREPIMNLTSLKRITMLKKYYEEIKPEEKGWLMGDTPLWLWMSNQGNIAFLDEITSVYRLLENSASHSTSYEALEKYNKSLLDIRLFFLEMYPVNNPKILTQIYDDYYKRNIVQAFKTGNYLPVYTNLKCISNTYWMSYVKTTIRIAINITKNIVKRITKR